MIGVGVRNPHSIWAGGLEYLVIVIERVRHFSSELARIPLVQIGRYLKRSLICSKIYE